MGCNSSSSEAQKLIDNLEKELYILNEYMMGTHNLYCSSSKSIQEDFLNSSYNNLYIIYDKLQEYFKNVRSLNYLIPNYKIKHKIIILLIRLEMAFIEREKIIYNKYTLLLMKIKDFLIFLS